jgi:hypothetical protein
VHAIKDMGAPASWVHAIKDMGAWWDAWQGHECMVLSDASYQLHAMLQAMNAIRYAT